MTEPVSVPEPTSESPSPPAVLRLALAGYARFTNDEVKSAAAKLADAFANELEYLDYDPSPPTVEATEELISAMNMADEATEAAEEVIEDEEEETDTSWEDEIEADAAEKLEGTPPS